MLFKIWYFTVFLLYLIVIDVLGQDYNLKLKHPGNRLPRSNSKTNNEEFEKFFLKASKSVPRIGRRGSMNDNYYTDGSVGGFYPYMNQPKRAMNKNLGSPFWSDIAQIYEYNPDLPSVMAYLSNLDQEQGDDPSVYDFNKMRFKKKVAPQNKEAMEYRLQAEI